MKAKTLARGLGWFSIAVGLSELFAPQALARFLGMEKHTRVLRTFGLREIDRQPRHHALAGYDAGL